MADRGERFIDLPMLHPNTSREAAVAATALVEAAAALRLRHPLAARLLEGRAQRVSDEAAELRQRRIAALNAADRWVRRPYKVGRSSGWGPGHITLPEAKSKTSDLHHRTVCGRGLTGRDLEFGPAVDPVHGSPAGWRPCGLCLDHSDRRLQAAS